jgi:hypothetical protein
VTNVPRSLASASTPALAGGLFSSGHLAVPRVLGGLAKATYDLLLLALFRAVPPRDES